MSYSDTRCGLDVWMKASQLLRDELKSCRCGTTALFFQELRILRGRISSTLLEEKA
ncbi:hypothetical protein DPMN_022996 [Dreissena polymorpha]|uniref:Uncharacterized protein n=1 Tax=Dreissena polymorpha TaxID=45954 RepID=A0A9D4LM15_DREPO|nr:hypothetical protein DPMN_022996 [Dreissena polymorpha]